MATAKEISDKLRANGWQGDIPLEILEQNGLVITDHLAGITDDELGPKRTDEEVKALHNRVAAEAEANNVPIKIIKGFSKVVGLALKAGL